SIALPDGEIHPVAFHSRTLTCPELNYDTHDKELLAIFEAFQKWQHYLEGSGSPVDVVTDHKNLEYFSTTKLLTHRQAHWSEFLSQFNLVIRFRPGKLGTKLDSLTRHWDVYPKEGDRDYAKVNPQNFHPVFTQEQLALSLRASYYFEPLIRAIGIMDVGQLHTNILSAQQSDSHSLEIITSLSGPNTDPRWSLDGAGLLRYDSRIWVPDANDLHLQILLNNHDHPVSGHFGQNKTLELVRRDYTWPGIRMFVKDYCKSCTTCATPSAVRISSTTPDPGETMEFNFNRFYWSVTIFLRLYINIGNCRSTYEASYFNSNPRHYHVCTTCRALRNPCVFQTRSSHSCHIQPRTRVRFPFLQISQKGFKYEASLHFRISPRRRWAN